MLVPHVKVFVCDDLSVCKQERNGAEISLFRLLRETYQRCFSHSGFRTRGWMMLTSRRRGLPWARYMIVHRSTLPAHESGWRSTWQK